MATVTIAATFGSAGSIIGPAVAKRLSLPFVDRAIPPALAEKIHEPLVAARQGAACRGVDSDRWRGFFEDLVADCYEAPAV